MQKKLITTEELKLNAKEKTIDTLINNLNLNGKEEEEDIIKNKYKFEPVENWETDKFDYFVMRTSRKD